MSILLSVLLAELKGDHGVLNKQKRKINIVLSATISGGLVILQGQREFIQE